MNYCTLVLEICLEKTISYQSRDSNLLSNFVHLQNTLSVKLIRSLETYYLPSKELILEVSVFSVKCTIFAFKPSCDSFLRFSFFFSFLFLNQNREVYNRLEEILSIVEHSKEKKKFFNSLLYCLVALMIIKIM